MLALAWACALHAPRYFFDLACLKYVQNPWLAPYDDEPVKPVKLGFCSRSHALVRTPPILARLLITVTALTLRWPGQETGDGAQRGLGKIQGDAPHETHRSYHQALQT